MKKIFLYIVGFVVICFIIPFIFTNKFETKTVETSENAETQKEENKTPYNYKEYSTIKLLHSKTGEIQEINLDEYLYGVVSSEMPASFEQEALKAQAVVARTYTIYTIIHSNNKHEGASICDDSKCCQAWITKEDRLSKWEESERETNWNKIVSAVDSTKGKIITYKGEPIDAFFHSNSGGTTEIPINVWGGSGYEYLQSVTTAGEDSYTQYSSEVEISKEELEQKVKEKYSDFQINWQEENAIQILEYTQSGRVKTLKVGNKNLSGVEARTIFGLKSTNFEFTINETTIKFNVKGYGHGVGMSQTGADAMAKQGSNFEEIIKHFYTGVEIIDY